MRELFIPGTKSVMMLAAVVMVVSEVIGRDFTRRCCWAGKVLRSWSRVLAEHSKRN